MHVENFPWVLRHRPSADAQPSFGRTGPGRSYAGCDVWVPSIAPLTMLASTSVHPPLQALLDTCVIGCGMKGKQFRPHQGPRRLNHPSALCNHLQKLQILLTSAIRTYPGQNTASSTLFHRLPRLDHLIKSSLIQIGEASRVIGRRPPP